MIWSIIKLIFGCLSIIVMTLGNVITWCVYFGWNNELYKLFWTDKEENIQYYYNYNIIGWAFQIKRLADSAFDITKKEHI